MCGHVGRMQNQRTPKQISKLMVIKMKRGRPRKNGEKVEEYLSIVCKKQAGKDRDRQNWRNIVSEAKVHNGLWRLS